jgi:O-antigen ligase
VTRATRYAVFGLEPPTAPAETSRIPALVDQVLVSLLVVALFLERFEKEWYQSGRVPLPDVFFVGAVCLLAARLAAEALRARRIRPVPSKEFALVLYVALLGVLSFAAILTRHETREHLGQVGKTYTHLVFLLLASLLAGRMFARGRLAERALETYFALAVLISVVTILQAIDDNVFFFGFSKALGLRSRTHGEVFARPMAIFSEPAYLGYAMLIGALIGVGLIARRRRLLASAGVTLCAVAFLLAGSAGAMLIAALVLTLAATRYVTSLRSVARPFLFPIAGVLAAVVVTLVAVPPVRQTITRRADSIRNGNDPSTELRKQQNHGSIEIWKKAPLTGVGLGNTRLYLPSYIHTRYDPGTGRKFSAANAYLGLLGEAGLLGPAGLVVVLLMLARRNAGVLSGAETLTQISVVILLLQFLIIGAFLLPPFWFWAGLRIGLQRRGSEVLREQTT